jgi:oligogalacturonide lyase
MHARGPRDRGWTRRSWLITLIAATRVGAQKRRLWPAERFTYADPATEFLLERLTNPAYASLLPPPHSRALAGKGGFLLFASDRSGSFQLYRMQERTGECEQLTEATSLDPRAFTLTADDRGFCYFDGPTLYRASLGSLKARAIYRVPEGWRRVPGFGLSPDGKYLAIVESRAGRWSLRLIRTGNGDATTLVERPAPIGDPAPGPREQVLYLHEGSLWLASRRLQTHQPLPAPAGRVLQACWSSDGRRVIYLHQPAEKGKLSALREYELRSGVDRLVAPTSQFASFGVNSDESVFLGASGSVASPYVLLLLRVTRRELTLCEHGAGDVTQVRPTFSADSRRIYFQSDRDGKPALYRMNVERLVEPTDSSASGSP